MREESVVKKQGGLRRCLGNINFFADGGRAPTRAPTGGYPSFGSPGQIFLRTEKKRGICRVGPGPITLSSVEQKRVGQAIGARRPSAKSRRRRATFRPKARSR